MITVKTLAQAYKHFRPYDPRRPAETVVIHGKGRTRLLHWDPALRIFTVDDGPHKQAFRGDLIETMR